MPITDPSGINTYSPKIRDQSIVRKFISQGGTGYIALSIMAGIPGSVVAQQAGAVDPDTGTLGLTVYFDDVTAAFPVAAPGTVIATVTADQISKQDVGMYYYEIGPSLTAYRGTLTAVWTYQVDSVPFTFTDHLQILNPMSFYDTLNQQEQSIVEQVSFMVGDVFDSTEGGPQLIEPFQTHYDFERLAQLERLAVTRFNLMSTFSNPPSAYGVGPGTQTVPVQAAGLLVIGTYLELVRHLTRSYVEIPAFPGTNVTFVDRRDYFQRWQTIYQTDWPEYQQMVRNFKVGQLDLGRGALLVAGGIYGGSALGVFQAGLYSSQVRSMRFYPAAPAIAWGATSH
jgi:hypothetical protein